MSCRHQSHQAVRLGAILQRAHTLLTPPGAHPDPKGGLHRDHTVHLVRLHTHLDSCGGLCSLHTAGTCPDACCGFPCPGAVQPLEVSHHHAALVLDRVHQWLGGSGPNAELHAGGTRLILCAFLGILLGFLWGCVLTSRTYRVTTSSSEQEFHSIQPQAQWLWQQRECDADLTL